MQGAVMYNSISKAWETVQMSLLFSKSETIKFNCVGCGNGPTWKAKCDFKFTCGYCLQITKLWSSHSVLQDDGSRTLGRGRENDSENHHQPK